MGRRALEICPRFLIQVLPFSLWTFEEFFSNMESAFDKLGTIYTPTGKNHGGLIPSGDHGFQPQS